MTNAILANAVEPRRNEKSLRRGSFCFSEELGMLHVVIPLDALFIQVNCQKVIILQK